MTTTFSFLRRSSQICVIFISIFFLTSCAKEDISEENPLTEIFIAHAGGKIDAYTYTNSLEALNLSYSKGCKMFELDIIESSDGVFVAAHHWSSYKAVTGDTGILDETPLSEQEFMSRRIFGTYTPMNMTEINLWFDNHKDAILVTDKINAPKRFAEKFAFKDRLIMELFSWSAVREAIEVGVKAMPSDNLIFSTPDIEHVLDSLNIKYVAVSYRYLAGNEEFFKRIKNKGIKTYVFHVNDDVGKDEKYFFETKLHLITGMYADDLSILQYNKTASGYKSRSLYANK